MKVCQKSSVLENGVREKPSVLALRVGKKPSVLPREKLSFLVLKVYEKPSFLDLRVGKKPSFLHSKPCIYAVYPTSKTVRFRKLRVCKTVLFRFEGVKIRVFQFITFTWLRNHFSPVSYPLLHGFILTLEWFPDTDFCIFRQNVCSCVSYMLFLAHFSRF